VTIAASTSCLAFSCELALETDFVARRVLRGDVVSRPRPLGLQVSNGLVAFGESSLPAGQETPVGVGVLPLVLGDWEHATAASSTASTTDARDFDDRPQLGHLSLYNFHPLVGDPGEAIIRLGLHGLKDAREIGCGDNSGDWSRPCEAQPGLDLALVCQHGPNGGEQTFLLARGEHTLQVLDEGAHDLHRVKEGSVQDMACSKVDATEEAEGP